MLRVDLAEDVPGVDPDAAVQWWTDFRNGHADHAFVWGAERRILARGPGFVRMEERVRPLKLPLFREESTVRVEGRVVRFDGENTVSHFEGQYAFEPTPTGGGTRIRLTATVTLKPALAWTRPVAARVARRVLRMDLRGHAREMGKDLARRG